MDTISLPSMIGALVVCLLASAFFSMAETAMMALDRYRLHSHKRQGNRFALCTATLLKRTDTLLSVILLGNTLINTFSATLATLITARLFQGNQIALGIATLLVTLAILLFSEATPKVIAATYPQTVAYAVSYPLSFLLKLCYPLVWLINLFVSALLKLIRLPRPHNQSSLLSREELKLLVLEAGRFIEKKHHSILMNLFDLESITVNDVMIPQHEIEAIDLTLPIAVLRRQIFTCHHTRLLVYERSYEHILGILHVRNLLHASQEQLSQTDLRKIIRKPYFIPADTPLFTQLQAFQENQRRLGLVVNEYGDLLGLVTIEDILEQMIGEFTTNAPEHRDLIKPQGDGSTIIDGKASLRDINRKLGTQFPLNGPKTLNGLILEHLQTIPENGICVRLAKQRLEITHVQDHQIKSVRLYHID